MSLPLSHYLKDFSSPAAAQPVFGETSFGDIDIESDPFDISFEAPEPEPQVDIEAEKRQSYAEGYEQAEREIVARYEAQIADMEEVHARQMAELREGFETHAGAAISSGLTSIAAEIANHVSEQTALVLAPVVSELVAAKTVKNLAKMIEMAILNGDAGTIVVRGPHPLFELLVKELPEKADLLRHVEADDLDLSVDTGETLLVTRLSAWTASLKKAIG